MANVYKDISEFIKKAAATGNEEFQVSATEKITAQQIADLASVERVKYVVVTNFRNNSWKWPEYNIQLRYKSRRIRYFWKC